MWIDWTKEKISANEEASPDFLMSGCLVPNGLAWTWEEPIRTTNPWIKGEKLVRNASLHAFIEEGEHLFKGKTFWANTSKIKG